MEERSMSSHYVLGGGKLAGCRLNLQHSYTQEIFSGHLIDPAIKTDKSALRIADVCTGTGIWLLQIAQQYPKAECEGLDITLAEVPHRGWCPANVRFRTFDLFADLPADLIERYDIINIQYTHLFVRDPAISNVLTTLRSMLKPNGWLQYTDMDVHNKQELMPPASPQKPVPDTISTIVQSAWDMSHFTPNIWTSQLSKLFNEAGLVDVAEQTPELPPSTLASSTQCILWGIEEGCVTALQKGIATREVVDDVMEKVGKAWNEHKELGAIINMRTTRCVGKKPVNAAGSGMHS